MALIKCEKCGHTVSDRAAACPHCGNPITQSDNSINTKNVDIDEQEFCDLSKKKSRKWIVVLIVLLLALCGGGAYFYFCRDKAEPIVILTKQFADKIRKYEKLGTFHDGLALVRRNGLWGYIDVEGNEVIPCIYKGTENGNYGFDFSEGMAVVIDRNGKYGYINTKGEIVIKPQFQQAGNFSESVASVYMDGKLNFIDREGNYIPELSNKFIWDFNANRNLPQFKNGVCEVHIPTKKPSEGVTGDIIYINKKGNQVKQPNEEVKKSLYVRYYEGDKVGYKDTLGHIIVKAKYTTLGDFSCGVAVATLEYGQRGHGMEEWYSDDYVGIYGYVDLKGNETFSPQDYAKIKQAELKAKKLETVDIEKNDDSSKGPQWINGSWFFEGNIKTSIGTMFMSSQLIIDRDAQSIKSYSKGELMYDGTYSISENEIHYGDTYIVLDIDKQLIKYTDDLYYSKGEPSSTNRAQPNSESNNNLLEYERKIADCKERLDRAYYRFQRDMASGRYDIFSRPRSYRDLLNACSDLYRLAQNAKKMAQKLGNDELALEYDKLSRWADNMSNMAEKVFYR